MNKIIITFMTLIILCSIGCAPDAAPIGGQSDTSHPISVAKPPIASGEISLDKNFYLVLDDSGSMGDRAYCGDFKNKIEAAKWAITEFATKVVSSDVNLGLYALNRGELYPIGKNRDAIVEKIKTINASNGTPLNYAIARATDALVNQRAKQLGYGEYYIVVATDGDGTDGDVNDSVNYATSKGIPIITIGFGIKNHPLKNKSISYREATNPDELLSALKETQGETAYFDSTTFK